LKNTNGSSKESKGIGFGLSLVTAVAILAAVFVWFGFSSHPIAPPNSQQVENKLHSDAQHPTQDAGAQSSDEVLYNGAVSAAHDLGNAFYLLTVTPMGNLRFYFGVERLRTDFPTFIEFELNQVQVRVGSGNPWWDTQGSRHEFSELLAMLTDEDRASFRDDRDCADQG
jgi:hypothetical protein